MMGFFWLVSPQLTAPASHILKDVTPARPIIISSAHI